MRKIEHDCPKNNEVFRAVSLGVLVSHRTILPAGVFGVGAGHAWSRAMPTAGTPESRTLRCRSDLRRHVDESLNDQRG